MVKFTNMDKEKMKLSNKKYYLKKRDKLLLLSQEHYIKNKKYYQKYYQENKEKSYKYHKEWIKNNKVKDKLYQKRYDHSFKGKRADNKENARRRIVKNHIIENFTYEMWSIKLIKAQGICKNCKNYVGIERLQLDHIYPVSKASKDFKLTGIKRIYDIVDIQPLCRVCNSSKNNKIISNTHKNTATVLRQLNILGEK